MKIKFLGAAGTVTGSSYLLTSDSGESILIDLGMFQGISKIDELNYLPYEADCSKLNSVILTHAHLDHCGRLPILESLGFTGNVFMTAPTCDLTALSLLDSAKINEENNPDRLLYDRDQVLENVKRFKIAEYDKKFDSGVFSITFRDAGHIIGSASIEIEVDSENIVFSGDLGNTPEDLTQPTELIGSADIVVMESTYGDRLHPPGEAIDVIRSEINAVENTKSTLLIPAFSLERTQELLHIISHLKAENKVRMDTPIYLDSPMAEKATNIYEKYRSYLNEEIKKDFMLSDPFSFPGINVTKNTQESELIDNIPGAKIIIAGSGMMTGGRILRHAEHYLPISSTRLLIVGYQGEETLGRQILDGAKNVEINGKNISVKAVVNDTQVMSSHADQMALIRWLKSISGVRTLILTHGEDNPRKVLADKVSEQVKIGDIRYPYLNQEIEI